MPRPSDEPDEEVVFDLRPHARRLVVPAVVAPATVGLASYGYFTLPWQAAQIAVAVIAVFVVVRYALRPWLVWLTTRYVLTTQRLVVRQGLLRRTGRDVPLTRIADLSMQRTVRDRIWRSGTLVVESGGPNGQVVLRDVPRVEAVSRELLRVVSGARD